MNQMEPNYSAVWAILAMLFVLALCYFVTKWLGKSMSVGQMTRGSYMRILDRIVLSREKFIMLVEVSGRVFVIGVTNQSVNVIGTVDELTELPQQPRPQGLGGLFKSMWPGKWGKGDAAAEEVYKYIDANEASKSFGSYLREDRPAELENKGESFTDRLDDMDEKMRARAEKFKSRNMP